MSRFLNSKREAASSLARVRAQACFSSSGKRETREFSHL